MRSFSTLDPTTEWWGVSYNILLVEQFWHKEKNINIGQHTNLRVASQEKIEGETKKRDELAVELARGSMEHSSRWIGTVDQETIIG